MKRVEMSAEIFGQSLGRFATGVTVVASLDAQGEICGMTANSFSSVSLEPPMVLVCISYNATCYGSIVDRGAFSVNILGAQQQHVATGFAKRGNDKTSICDWSLTERRLPILQDSKVALECEIAEAFPGGDHAILLGRVVQIHHGASDEEPLLFCGGRLFSLPGLAAAT